MVAGQTVTALWLESGSPELAEAAVHHGWTTILIDNEHGVADLAGAVAVHRAVLAAGGDAILRIPSADPATLKGVLDRGFRSIMAPMVSSVAAAKVFAEACLYPPRGSRGYAAPVVRASGYGIDAGYRARAHEDMLLIAQIEHVDAVDDVDAIAAVPGIDMLFMGPNDLSGSIGRLEEMDAPDAAALCDRCEAAILKSPALYGTIPRPGHTAQALSTRGARLICGPTDIGLFVAGARASRADFLFD